MKRLFPLVLILLFSWFLLSFKLTEVPPAINGDEVSLGLNAILLSKTMHDETGRFMPLFVHSLNKGDFKQPISVYATVFLFKLFGPSYTLLRQMSIFFVLVSMILTYLFIKEVFDEKLAIFGSLVFLTIPIIMIQSHLALENIAPVPFILFWLLMIYKFQNGEGRIPLFLAGISLGLSFYSYLGMRLILPVVSTLTVFYILYLKKKAFLKHALIFCLGIAPFILILPWIHQQYPGAILANSRPQTPNTYQEFFYPYLSTFDPSFLFISGDSTPYHSTGAHGMFLLSTLPFFLIGCYVAIKRKDPFLIFSLIVFFMIPIFFSLVDSVHRASRLLSMIPPFIVLTITGLKTIFGIKVKLVRNLIIFLSFIIIFLNYFDFISDYWYSYPGRVKSYFPGEAHIAFEILYRQSKELGFQPVIQTGVYTKEDAGAKFFEQVYFPGSATVLKSWELGQPISEKSVLLHHKSDLEKVLDLGFKKMNVETDSYNLSVKY